MRRWWTLFQWASLTRHKNNENYNPQPGPDMGVRCVLPEHPAARRCCRYEPLRGAEA